MGSDARTRPPLAASQKPLRVALYLLTVATAVAALFLQPALSGAVGRGALSRSWLFLPIALFGTLFITAAVDRWMLVRRRRYPAGRAFFQVAFGLIFALLLLPSTMRDFKAQKAQGDDRLFLHVDPDVRRVAVLAQGFRGPDDAGRRKMVAALGDGHPTVRQAAAEVLSRWSGKDLADEAGLKRWAEGSSATVTSTTMEKD